MSARNAATQSTFTTVRAAHDTTSDASFLLLLLLLSFSQHMMLCTLAPPPSLLLPPSLCPFLPLPFSAPPPLSFRSGECVSQCPESTAHANTRGSYNRKCTQAFTCDNEVSSLDGSLCVCPDQHCVTCHYEAGNSPGDSTCTACEAGYTLIQNQCVSD